MKTFQYRYKDKTTFAEEMDALQKEVQSIPGSTVLVHIFAECWCQEEAAAITAAIRQRIPRALLVGTASFGNIYEGGFTREDIVVIASVFEDPDTQVEVLSVSLDPAEADSALNTLLEQIRQRSWVKAVEAFIMADVPVVTKCCDALSNMPRGIDFFGGKSRFDHAPEAPKFVITNEGTLAPSMGMIVLYGGRNLHIKTGMIQGWKPLGRAMKVTRFEGDRMYELEGRPAFELYHKYLNIDNDENYFFSTLEFPILVYKDGKSVIRISHACLGDGTMLLGATIPENDYVRIAFGDANEIMKSVLEGGKEFDDFRPDAFLLYSCGCRRTYWGDEKSNRETLPFQAMAQTGGFYTAGELLRDEDGKVIEHNSTIVVAAFREGDAADNPAVTFGMDDTEVRSEDSVVFRLSSFIHAAIDELEEANRTLEKLSITDGLTGLFNRRETERRIQEILGRSAEDWDGCSLIMLDIDNFKSINDTYGHNEGDAVLQGLAGLLTDKATALGDAVRTGRWGGEEFLVILTGEAALRSQEVAEQIRSGFSALTFPHSGHHTLSLGVTHIDVSENVDAVISRVDAAMYEAKHLGKNQVVEI